MPVSDASSLANPKAGEARLLDLGGGVTLELVWCPPGEFTMGSDTGGDAASRPAHTVYVDAFYIDKYEATNESYGACAYVVDCRKSMHEGSATRNTYFSNPVFANYPVIYIDWRMAKAYCEWRGARLPTEFEWERAARGLVVGAESGNLGGAQLGTTPVGQFAPEGSSPYGLADMSGNVWEWCWDWYDPGQQMKTLRGASWFQQTPAERDRIRCEWNA